MGAASIPPRPRSRNTITAISGWQGYGTKNVTNAPDEGKLNPASDTPGRHVLPGAACYSLG